MSLIMQRAVQLVMLSLTLIGGGGRSAVQIVDGTDVVTAGGGGGGADCRVDKFCGGGGKTKLMHCASSCSVNKAITSLC